MSKIYLFAIFLLLLIFSVGCTSTKNVAKGSTEIQTSTEKDDSIRTLIAERDRMIELYNEAVFGGVVFDTAFIHDTTIKREVVIRDGEIIAKGPIKSAFISKSAYELKISEKNKLIDSLSRLKEKTNVVVKTEYKDKIVKRTVFPWWFLLVGGAIFILIMYLKKKL